MKAIAVENFGDEPGLMELPDPEPGPGEVLVAIGTASINPIDWKAAQGAFRGMMENEFPLVLGFDGAGRVEALGRAQAGSPSAISSTASSGATRLAAAPSRSASRSPRGRPTERWGWWTDGIQFDFYDQEPQVTLAIGAIVEHLHSTFGR